jgi:uncharacterized membrane protein affecting hemolysin expression
MEEKTQNRKRRIIIILIAFVILVIGGMLLWQIRQRQAIEANRDLTLTENLELQHELDSLLFTHEQLKGQYGDLTMQLLFKDSLIIQKADSIRMLIRRSADYNAIRKELNQLREESSMYMAHIDSLYRVTQILEAENVEIRSQYQAEQIRSQKLSMEKTELSQKVTVGSILKAYNIIATAYRTSSGVPKPTDKARRTERLEICFTIGENLVAESGKKDVFVRITRPDKQVLTRDASSNFLFNGETISYSIKQNIRYLNREMSLCLHWDKIDDKAEAMPGVYDIVIIVDGFVIGQSQIELK